MRRFALLSVAVAVLSALPARNADAKLDDKTWAELEKNFKQAFPQAGQTDRKMEILKDVVKDGEVRAWRVLAEGLVLESQHVARIALSLSDDLQKLQSLLGKKLRYPAEDEEMYSLQAKVGEAERAKAGEERVLKGIVMGFAGATEDGRKLALVAGKGHKDWPARAAVARVAAGAADEKMSKDVLTESLEKDKDPRVKIAALDALQTATGTSWYPLVVARIKDPDWGVQLLAVRIAGSREMGKAIPELIQVLGTASPRVLDEVGKALTKLTGQSIEPYPEPWQKWWEANREKWGPDGRPVIPVPSKPNPIDVEYYGIKIKTDKVMFIIDISGSMLAEKKAPEPPKPKGPTTGDAPPPPPEGKFSGPKIEIAKKELKRALQKLPKTAMFDIIAFNHNVVQWQPKMVAATDANKELAYAWIRDMSPSGSTYIDGALRLAFKMAGMEAYDPNYTAIGIDTIFLLSDGAPTDNAFPESKEMPPQEILDHVKEWNPLKRVVIHCIGIDNVVQGIDFMKKLASQNGGTYVDG